MKEKTKVIAYIVRDIKGYNEVLVFDHEEQYPDAGTQVVGGTVEEKEAFLPALIREVFEESGLSLSESDFRKLGETTYNRKDRPEVNFRHYFLCKKNDLPETWDHTVESDGEDNGMIFTFFWLSFDEAKKRLTGNFFELLDLV